MIAIVAATAPTPAITHHTGFFARGAGVDALVAAIPICPEGSLCATESTVGDEARTFGTG